MAKMSELSLTVGELRNAAQSLIAVVDSLTALFSNNDGVPELTPAITESKPIALETIRAVLAEKSRDGHTAEVRALLKRHGASKLSEIDSAKYAALLSEAEGIGNG